MNGQAGTKFEFMQDRIARENRDNILLALRELKSARSSEITKWVNDKVKREVKGEYDKEIQYFFDEEKQLSKQKDEELRLRQMTKRAVQKWLAKLIEQGLVYRNEYDVCSLTVLGKKKIIFDRLYGEILFYELVEKPQFKGTDKERIDDCIKRFGTYILCVFLYNLTIKEHSLTKKDFLENFLGWVEQTISPRQMFQWFFYIFLHDELHKHNNFKDVLNSWEKQNVQYFKAFERSNERFKSSKR